MKTRNLIFSWGAKKWGEATSSIQTVKVLPEFESIVNTYSHEGEGFGWFDAGKLERVILNLFFNAGEAVPPDSGRIEMTSRVSERGAEIRVADNGPGIPDSISRESLSALRQLWKSQRHWIGPYGGSQEHAGPWRRSHRRAHQSGRFGFQVVSAYGESS